MRLIGLLVVATVCACGAKHSDPGGATPDASADATPIAPDAQTTFTDFPPGPVIDPSLPPDIASQFGSATTDDAGPCLVEPAIGALFPPNWTPPLFVWSGAFDVFELTVTVDNQLNPLVVFTPNLTYTLDTTVWPLVSGHSTDHDLQIEIRGGNLGGGTTLMGNVSVGTTGAIHIAPAAAAGAVVYWTPSKGSALIGFTAGSSTLTTLITPASFVAPDRETCVGCHTSAPDGKTVFLSRGPGPFFVDARDINTGLRVDPSVVSANAIANLGRKNQTLPSLSAAHYSPTDAAAVSVLETGGTYDLVYTDLHATTGGTNVIARTADPGQAATPSFSHDGTQIAYTSSASVTDGRLNSSPADVYLVPYNAGAGGAATKLEGASDTHFSEYYPVFSPDDKLVAFDRVASGTNMYAEGTAELYLVPSSGGTPTRLLANDPPMCTGKRSPGVSNSWPRFAPDAQQIGDTTYYWIVFSSVRLGGEPQLYVAGITVDGAGMVTSYPAIYVASQDPTDGNHTPAWDDFQIPIQ